MSLSCYRRSSSEGPAKRLLGFCRRGCSCRIAAYCTCPSHVSFDGQNTVLIRIRERQDGRNTIPADVTVTCRAFFTFRVFTGPLQPAGKDRPLDGPFRFHGPFQRPLRGFTFDEGATRSRRGRHLPTATGVPRD